MIIIGSTVGYVYIHFKSECFVGNNNNNNTHISIPT